MSQGSRLLFTLFILLVAAAGCRQSAAPTLGTADVALSLSVEPEEPTTGPSTLVITVTDSDGRPVNDAAVTVRGDMTHAGMQPVLAAAEAIGDGHYEADFEWTMAGDWIVTVSATLPDGRTATQEFPAAVSP